MLVTLLPIKKDEIALMKSHPKGSNADKIIKLHSPNHKKKG